MNVELKTAIGKITFIDESGWGFILSKDVPFTRIFFHWTQLRQDTLNFKDIEEGMKVEFIPKEIQDKGYRAYRIKIIPEDVK